MSHSQEGLEEPHGDGRSQQGPAEAGTSGREQRPHSVPGVTPSGTLHQGAAGISPFPGGNLNNWEKHPDPELHIDLLASNYKPKLVY